MFDYASYRKIVLNLIDRSMYHLVPRREIHKYKNYMKYIMEFDYKMQQPANYMVGYFVSTIDGKKWMPVFDHDIGRKRNKMNIEFLKQFEERKKNALMTCLMKYGIPDVALRIIHKYLSNPKTELEENQGGVSHSPYHEQVRQ